MPQSDKTARIILEDGTEFEGTSFGHDSSVAGEIVFYAGAAGLPRLLTDPSLRGVILVLAQPVAGITGIGDSEPGEFGLETAFESSGVQIAGLVVSSHAAAPSHRTAKKSLARWLKKQQVPAICGIDTRALIQRLCLRGAMRAKILVSDTRDVSFSSAGARSQAADVSVKRVTRYGDGPKTVILVDCGARHSVIRALAQSDVTVVRVPLTYDYTKEPFDGVVVSGGPGDPTSAEKTIEVLRAALALGKPTFATGLGAVILALAGGASAFRMAQGHRSAATPCVDLETGRCWITAQNHGYGIRDNSLPEGWTPSFLNNADNSIEGFSAKKGLVSGVLFQPEGKPGPDDTAFLYCRFLDLVRKGGVRE